MITSVEVRGFKRFSRERFEFSPLTVLTGLNGSGKTSLIQSLLAAWEASSDQSNALRLNGPFGLQLGTAEDVLNWNSKPPIEIEIQEEAGPSAVWRFDVSAPDALYLSISDRPSIPPIAFSRRPRAFTYLSAERFGPRNFLGTSPVPDDQLEVGVQGEYCAHVLSVLGSKVLEYLDRKHPVRGDSGPNLLKYEVEHWLGEVAKPVEITAERLANSSVSEITFKSPGTEPVKPPNMGFGISYALPIILGGLIARTDGLIIVENPEAHLHPAGQSRIGVFLAWLVSKGIQVVLETHSDHVLNGIRRAIAEYRFLPATLAVAHFFGAEGEGDRNGWAQKLNFNEVGSISHWPQGFFDQYQSDVASLGRVRRQR
jgi:predicted ATPase